MFNAVMTLVAFAMALNAVPISGAFCRGDCVEYPYLDTIERYPSDFAWMIPAMLVILGFVVLMSCLHITNGQRGRAFNQVALSFALIAATILLANYYVQFFVVPASLMHSAVDGIPLIIQYNPHGAFLALEELGYIVMSIAFLFAGASIAARSRLEAVVR